MGKEVKRKSMASLYLIPEKRLVPNEKRFAASWHEDESP